MKFLKLENLTFVGAICGLILGLVSPDLASKVEIFGEIFILLLKLIIVPLIIVSIFLAVSKQDSIQNMSSLGLKTMVYFMISSILACLTGFLCALLLPAMDSSNLAYENYQSSNLEGLTFKAIILSFFSGNPFKSLAEGNIIQIVVISLFVGAASLQLDERKKKVILDLVDGLNDLVLVMVKWILFLAPIGVFSLVADVTAEVEPDAFTGLGWLMLAIVCAASIHSLLTLPLLGFLIGKFNPYKFLFNIKEALLVALATASSSATLPVSTRVLEKNENVSPKTAGFVLPLGATINMDGSSLYQTLVVLFLANVAGIDITFTEQIYIFFLILISSVGTAGIPGGGILMLGAVLQNVGVPLEYLGLYLLVDRLWDPPITMINVLGDMFGAKIIDRRIT